MKQKLIKTLYNVAHSLIIIIIMFDIVELISSLGFRLNFASPVTADLDYRIVIEP